MMYKYKKFIVVFFLILFSYSCGSNPERWEHVDIEQLNSSGVVVMKWDDTKVLSASGFFLSEGNWVRFRTSEGKEITLSGLPYRFLYR